MTFNFLGPGLTVNVEAKVKEQIILDSSDPKHKLFCVKAACLSLKLSVYCSDFFRRVKKMEKGEREQKDKAKIIAVSSVMSIIGSGAILLAAQFFS